MADARYVFWCTGSSSFLRQTLVEQGPSVILYPQVRAASFSGRFPCRIAPAIGSYSNSWSSATHRRRRPPLLISPRPTKLDGNKRRSPKKRIKGSAYFLVLILPSKTASQSGPHIDILCAQTVAEPCNDLLGLRSNTGEGESRSMSHFGIFIR